MHAAPHRPVRGNWIWLGSGLLTVTALTAAALHYAHDAVPGPMAATGVPSTETPARDTRWISARIRPLAAQPRLARERRC